jgi:hypothetical protein
MLLVSTRFTLTLLQEAIERCGYRTERICHGKALSRQADRRKALGYGV